MSFVPSAHPAMQTQQVLKLLIKAWERRLTFTIGTSLTLGRANSVVWNEIHHKTQLDNRWEHGFPDNKYIGNVLQELYSQGVFDSDDDDETTEDEGRRDEVNQKIQINCRNLLRNIDVHL